jgi:putative addiction module component (TIGR02574 family)
MRTNPHFDFSHLTPAERIELAQDLWDSLEPEEIAEALPLTEAQKAELDRRLEDLERDPDAGIPWEQVRAEIEAGLADVNARRPRRGG